jgi:hypothetical protein
MVGRGVRNLHQLFILDVETVDLIERDAEHVSYLLTLFLAVRLGPHRFLTGREVGISLDHFNYGSAKLSVLCPVLNRIIILHSLIDFANLIDGKSTTFADMPSLPQRPRRLDRCGAFNKMISSLIDKTNEVLVRNENE